MYEEARLSEILLYIIVLFLLETIQPVFKTVLGSEFPYDPQELIVFGLIG